MNTINTIHNFRTWRKEITGSLGFVPTMGSLHDGHLSLVAEANKLCTHTVVSIYLNPAQFTPDEDLATYPQNLKHDLKVLSQFQINTIFIPTDSEMYPRGYSTYMQETQLSTVLEGRSRPLFFQGVATVVAKFFNIVRPTHAFFGEKDAQQCLVIEKMVSDLNIRTGILKVPTVRDADGLAVSSRNLNLSKSERDSATIIYKSLFLARKLHSEGIKNANFIKKAMSELIRSVPFTKQDYISISEPSNLKELDLIECDALVSVAVFVGKTRLIDNIYLNSTD